MKSGNVHSTWKDIMIEIPQGFRLGPVLFSIPKNPENKPRGLYMYFSKIIFEGAYFWRGLYSEGLMYGGKFAFQNR